jgi:uncharacterized protein (AIM24 family)
MKYAIQCQPSYSILEVELDPGEPLVADAGAMAWMSSNVKTTTTTRGGVLAGCSNQVMWSRCCAVGRTHSAGSRIPRPWGR